MMTQLDAIREAILYLFNSEFLDKNSNIHDYELNRSLQYNLCMAFDRLTIKNKQSLVPKDIHLLIECWLMSKTEICDFLTKKIK